MAWVIAVVVLVVVVAAIVALAVARRPSGPTIATEPAAPAPPPRPEPEPMTGLESALARVTDRDGRPMRERIDEEAEHVDGLRVPDDTGPLLRRALDHVEHHDGHPDGHDDEHHDEHHGEHRDTPSDGAG